MGRDYYVRLDTNDYSVDPTVIGRMVDVAADLEQVRVRADGRIVAEHPASGPEGPPHRPGTRRGGRIAQFQRPRTAAAAGDDLVRDLSDYDRAFGLSDTDVDGIS